MAKDMSGFLKSFAGNLGQQMGNMSGLSQVGGPMSGIGILKQLMGGDNEGPDGEDNPGMRMFKGQTPAANEQNFGQRFLKSMQDNLFQSAMTGFMNRGPY